MTYRLTPVGSCGGAEAVLGGVLVEVVGDHVIGDVAGCGREVASLPEALAPVSLADVLELLLDLARRTALGAANEVADRDVRWYLDEQVDVMAPLTMVTPSSAQTWRMISRTRSRTSPCSTLYRYLGHQTMW